MVLGALLSFATGHPVFSIGFALFVAVLAWLSKPMIVAWKTAQSPDHPTENFFTKTDGSKGAFAQLSEPASKFVSLIIPAYNEEERMAAMLDEMLAFLERKGKADRAFTYELIIVDDGSKDKTAEIAMEYVQRYGDEVVRLCRLYKNCGKGGAVRKGMMRARGQYLLMVDADGATQASCLDTMLEKIRTVEKNSLAIAVGSRAHLHEADSTAKRKWYRVVLMQGFHLLVSMVIGGGSGIKDTQCGFKLFTREAAMRVFPNQHIERWAFDVELLFLACRQGVPLVEVPVNWCEVDGSKVDVLADTISMARDLLMIRMCYLFGVWKYHAMPADKEIFRASKAVKQA